MEEPTSQPPPPPPSDRAEHLLAAALDHAAEEREAFLITACEGDAVLLADVRALLAAHEAMPTGFLGSAVAAAVGGSPTSHLDPTIQMVPGPRSRPHEMPMQEQAGERIGRYKLLQEIGEGGFGTVWMAEQLEPVTRRVALKIIKLGMDTKEVIARFEAERQALAMMEHPNIAKVLDAGATEKGRPFFVMELVRGLPITQYCDEAGLGTRERLALFGDVCAAIQHAHQKGIIHRDIKPSNVMVTLYAEKPVVKVIDFGIAKATQSKLTDKTLFTRFEQFIGTPVYMSPEQASRSSVDIDTRSDIYSLGVLLYEILVGKPPFDSRSLLSAGYEEMRRIIREVEPAKPSSRLSTVAGEERTLLAKAHRIQPEKLERLVEPDLDWIVMKAIDKDRARRYETANAFAEDIRRFLADEAVSATPPSAGYQFRKFVRRHKAALNVAGAIATVLVLATLVSMWQAVRAMRAEKKTAETLVQVAAERDAKDTARRDAEEIATFLSNVFQSPDPARDGRTITVAETLDKAVKKLETSLTTQPAQKARLQSTLGGTYLGLGLARQSTPLLEKALEYYRTQAGPEHPSTLEALSSLAASYSESGRPQEALKMREDVLSICRRVFGPEHRTTLRAMSELAISYDNAGRREEALKLREEMSMLGKKAYGPEDPDRLSDMMELAASYVVVGRKEEALKLHEEALPLSRKVFGLEHPSTISAMSGLANSYMVLARYAEAVAIYEKVVPLSRKVSGPEHPETLGLASNLALSLYFAGRASEAVDLQEQTLVLIRRALPSNHPALAHALRNLAKCYTAAGRADDALKMNAELLEISRQTKGPEHPETVTILTSLAASYGGAGQVAEEIKLREQALAISLKTRGPGDATLLMQKNNLAWKLVTAPDIALRNPTRALELAGDAARRIPANANFVGTLGVSQYRAGDYTAAITSLEKSISMREKATNMRENGRVANGFFLAMARWQVGDKEQARKDYDLAVSWMSRDAGKKEEDLLRFRQEAVALLGVSE